MSDKNLTNALCMSAVKAFKKINKLIYESSEKLTSVCGIHEMQPDDELLKVDKKCADIILTYLNSTKIPLCVIIEESKDPIYLNCDKSKSIENFVYIDPFDGSKLFKRQFNAFWASAIGFYIKNMGSCGVVANYNDSEIFWTYGDSIFIGYSDFHQGSELKLDKTNNMPLISLSSMYVETYLMDPLYYLNSYKRLNRLLSKVRCIVPNGGPFSFVDVLLGKVDLYIGLNESITEVFSGLPIAISGGLKLKNLDGTTFDHKNFGRNEKYNFICARNDHYINEALQYID